MVRKHKTGKTLVFKLVKGIIITTFGGILTIHNEGKAPAQSPLPHPTHLIQPKPVCSHPLLQAKQVLFSSRLPRNESEGLLQVVGAASPYQADQIAQELQTTWHKMAQLADRWTQAHRQSDFPGHRLILLLGANRMHFPQPITYRTTGFDAAGHSGRSSSEAMIWLLDQQPATVLMTTTPTTQPPQQLLGELKRQMVLVFLSHLPNGQQMPLWVRMGLAEYIAESPSGTAWPAQMPPLEALPKEPVWGQAAPEHLEINPEAYASCRQWVRYLLEGRDAQYAPAFVEALGSANPRIRLETLLQQVRLASGPAGQWKPEFGLPMVRPVSLPMELGETERKLVFVFKLAWRFADRQPSAGTQPKIIEQGQDRSVQIAWRGEKPAPNGLKELQERILDPRRARWATLDWNGELLFSEDLARWQDFFTELQAKYRLLQYQEEHKTLLQLQHPEGGVLEGWLETNPQDADRPIVCLRRSKA